MFDKLEDLVKRLDEVMQELSEPDVVSDQNRFRNLMKEQNELAPIVEKYKEYKEAKQTIEDSVEMLEEEHDEEMRELLKEELSEAKKNVEQYEEELKVLLLPKDPNDDKNVIVEIRAGAGGDEAALFAAEIYRMYKNYAESKRWKTEFIDVNENGIGGFKEVSFMINGQGAYSEKKKFSKACVSGSKREIPYSVATQSPNMFDIPAPLAITGRTNSTAPANTAYSRFFIHTEIDKKLIAAQTTPIICITDVHTKYPRTDNCTSITCA